MSDDSNAPQSGGSAAAQQVEADAHFSIIPTLPKDRVWGMADFTVVNAALAIATWCFITGGYIAYVLPAKAGVAVVFFALLFGFGLVLIGCPLPAAKYGIDLCQHARSSMGTHGAGAVGIFVIMVMVYLNCAIIYPMLGKGITNIIQAFTPLSDTADYWLAAVFGIIALLLTWVIVFKGPVYIKWFNWAVAPGLVIVMIILLVFIFKDYGWSQITAAKPSAPSGDNLWDYAIAIEWSFGFAFSWWWIMGSMSRITKTQRAVAVGFIVGESFPAGIAIVIGLFTALVVGSFDPTEWLVPIGGRFWGVIGLIFMVFANITSGALMAYSGGMAFRTFRIGRKWSWKVTTFIVLSPAMITMLFQDFIYTRIGQVLTIWAILLAPLTAVVFVDYFLLRKQHLDLRAVYDNSKEGKYYFWKGVNPAFVLSVLMSFGFYYWMLDPISLRSSGLFRYTTAALPTFVLAGVLYYALTKLIVVPRGWGAYPKLPRERVARKQEIERLGQTI